MPVHVHSSVVQVTILLGAAAAATLADTINFENQCPSGQQASGPCSTLFSTVGNAQNLTIPTSIGPVLVQGGALFDNITNLPSDETAAYGTAESSAIIGVFPGSDFMNPLTITFPQALRSFSVDVLNGNTTSVDYHLADNLGNSADFLLAPNLSGGLKTMFLARGSARRCRPNVRFCSRPQTFVFVRVSTREGQQGLPCTKLTNGCPDHRSLILDVS
jgi:hypothetical protein